MSVSSPTNDAEIGRVQQLLRSYVPDARVFDELLEPDGTVRPAWLPLIAYFARLSDQARRSAGERLARALRDNRVTFIAQGDTERADRPWPLDLFPFAISPREWASLALGLAQRARLLNEILRDLYGEQRVVKHASFDGARLAKRRGVQGRADRAQDFRGRDGLGL